MTDHLELRDLHSRTDVINAFFPITIPLVDSIDTDGSGLSVGCGLATFADRNLPGQGLLKVASQPIIGERSNRPWVPQIAPKKHGGAVLWQSGKWRRGRPIDQWCLLPAGERDPG